MTLAKPHQPVRGTTILLPQKARQVHVTIPISNTASGLLVPEPEG